MLRDPDGQAIVIPTVAPEPDVPDNPDAIHGARGHDGRWFAVPSREEANEAFVTEAPADGSIYGRNGQTGQWELTTAVGLQITSIIPDKAIWGPGEPLLTVHAYGTDFTVTCVIRVDGNDAQTAYVSETELTFVMNPAVPINDQYHIITVHDPAAVPPAPVDGQGAEQFDFIKASTEVDYGRGLSLDTLPDPPIVNLDPAGPTNMGGVIVPVRDGSTNGLAIDMGNEALGDPATGHLTAPPATATLLGTVKVTARNKHSQGLNLDSNGFLFAPPATHEHLGSIVEPPVDRQLWGRTHDDNGNPAWEAFDPVEDVPENAVETFGRTARGWVPLATGRAGGGVLDDERYVNVTGDQMRGTLLLAHEGAVAMEAVTVSQLNRVMHVGLNPPANPEQGSLWWNSDSGDTLIWFDDGNSAAWVQTAPGGGGGTTAPPPTLTFRYGLEQTGDIVDVTPATGGDQAGAPELGGVYATRRDDNQGLVIDSYGHISVPLATPDLAGSIREPRETGKQFARERDATTGLADWVEITGGGMEEPPAEPVGMWGRTSAGARGWALIDQTGALIAGNTPTETGVIYVPDDRGLNLSPDGAVTLRPAGQYPDLGGMFDAPLNDGPYVRDNGQWAKLPEAASDFVTVGRSPIQALDEGFDPVLQKRSLFVPLATDFLAGAIVEPPADDKKYVRTNSIMGGGPQWVAGPSGVAVGDVPPAGPIAGDLWFESDSGSLFVFYDDGDSAQWVETGSGSETKATIEIGDAPPPNPTPGMFWWNSTTGQTFIFYPDGSSDQWVQIAPGPEGGGTAGGITDAPLDGLQYGRQSGTWTEVVTSHTTISDTPPINPQIADLWFQGTTLDTFIYYDDGSGPIWVQQNTPADFTGYVTDAPVDGTPYSRQDAAWVPAIGAPPPPIATDTVLGLVMPALRGAANGINIDTLGVLSVPLATEALAGSIVEPPADGAPYIRTRTAAGVSSWAPSTSGVIVSDTAPVNPTQGMLWWDSTSGETYLWFEDVGGPPGQWVQQAPGTGGEPFPEAPVDGKQYARQDAAWSEVVAGMFIGDAPPANPIPGAQWFNSTTLNSFVFYEDPTSSQWIQFAPGAAPDLSSYATEAWVADQIANATIDAQAFVATALSNAPGHDTDLCQQALAAVTKLSATVDQLVKGHHSLKARIKALEARHA